MYRIIHNSLRDFRTLRYSSLDGHAEGEHVNRGETLLVSVLPNRCSICPFFVSVLVVAQPMSEVPEGLMNYPVL